MREQFFEKFLSQSFSENEYFLTADVGFKFLDALKKTFGNHFINVGIAEKNMLAIAAGLANEGKKVFCYSIGSIYDHRGLFNFKKRYFLS